MASRNLKNIVSRAGEYLMGAYPGTHELILYGKAAEPVVLRNRGTETHLSAEDIRQHVLTFVAEHPDEFEGSVRAITALWDLDRENHLNHGIHTFSLSQKERTAIRQAVTESENAR
jgi:hypothetical protein